MHKRTDNNHTEIVEGLRQVGASVQNLSDVGAGCPDILVGFRSKNYLLEIKTDTGKLRANQVEWHNLWRGQVATVRTVDEALSVIGMEVLT